MHMYQKKWWYNENNDKHLFHKIDRSRFIMSPSTGKYKLLHGVHAYVAVGGMTASTLALLLLLSTEWPEWPDNVRHLLLDMGLI